MRKSISNPTAQQLTYGTYTPLFFENNIRYDEYLSKRGDVVIEAVLCLDSNDLSPVQTDRTLTSIKNCHSCFANYAHTVNLCNNRNK